MSQLKALTLAGKRVLIRVDFNVPLDGTTVTDDTRIMAALPTIQHVISAGGKAILMSHLGRPKGERKPELSLAPIAKTLAERLGQAVTFVDQTVGEVAQNAIAKMNNGDVVLLENTRYLAGEKKNDPEMSKQLADLADVYINDAFGTAHRAHASTHGVTQFIETKAMGFLLQREVDYLTKALDSPERPFVAILGGAKISDKIEVIEALLDKVDKLLIGGAMSFTLLKAQGHTIGTSLVEDDKLEMAKDLLARAGGKIILPSDHIVADAFSNDANISVSPIDIPDGLMALDIGPESIVTYQNAVKTAKTVIWNGPAGVFELSNFAKGTFAIADALVEATEAGALTIVGGGDSVAAINAAKCADKVSHVSTGGGAMLEFLEGKVLPGVDALT